MIIYTLKMARVGGASCLSFCQARIAVGGNCSCSSATLNIRLFTAVEGDINPDVPLTSRRVTGQTADERITLICAFWQGSEQTDWMTSLPLLQICSSFIFKPP